MFNDKKCKWNHSRLNAKEGMLTSWLKEPNKTLVSDQMCFQLNEWYNNIHRLQLTGK